MSRPSPAPASASGTSTGTSTGASAGASGPGKLDADSLGVSALWSAVAHDAEETINEGRRFWGQLVRSVAAADPRQGSGKIDL